MATLNPKTLSWRHDNQRTDGSEVGYGLAFEIGIRPKDQGAPFEVVWVMPAALNPDGQYQAGTDMPGQTLPELFAIPLGVVNELAVRALDLGTLPGDPGDDARSEWSESVEVVVYGWPTAPTGLVAA